MSDRLWGWTRFLRASGASEQRLQFPRYAYTLYCLANISCYSLIFAAISDHTLTCTMWKYYYLCKTIDKLLTFVSTQFDEDFRLLGLVRVFQCPYVPNRWFVTHLYASRARCARSKTIAQQNQSLLRSLFHKEATYLKFANVSDRLWGWTRFLRVSGASEQRSQFPSYIYALYCLAYISCYYLILSAISDMTLHCSMWK